MKSFVLARARYLTHPLSLHFYSSQSLFSSSPPSDGWNIDEINQEIEEICGSFTDPFSSSFSQMPSTSQSQPNSIEPIPTSSSPLRPIDRNPHEMISDPPKSLNSRSLPSHRNLLLISRNSLSFDVIQQLSSSSQMTLSPQLWDGSLTSLLSLVTSQDSHEGIVFVEEEGQDLDSDCEKIIHLVAKSCPVIVVNHSQRSEQQKRVVRVSGVDLREGISLAMFGLRRSSGPIGGECN
jgi:hypothetical protein